ncbi:MAG TPA: hypothetical protein EYP71_03310 [Dehalococcoidia bacterium]|nr:hypothetical protein [Dehalococcoidia bacterium]
MKRLLLAVVAALCLQPGFCSMVASATEDFTAITELNFVFIHGALGVSCTQQLLADTILEYAPAYVYLYERDNPGVKVKINVLNRCYPNDVDIDTWAHNIANSVERHLPEEGSIVFIGHSMGGKSALYAVARNIGNLADRTALVVTINSPIKSLDRYPVAGGGSFLAYCRAALWNSTGGVCLSAATYDSSEDGRWVAQNKHWLAFISGEKAPLSEQFDYGGIDPYPRDMDDGAIPIEAQYSEDADVVYYGEHGHSEFGTSPQLADFMAQQILDYIFGGAVACSVYVRGGSFGHRAGWQPGTDHWRDLVGDILGTSGRLWHWNQSYTRWQEWEDIISYHPPTHENDRRSRYQIRLTRSSGLFTGIEELRWLKPDSPQDCRVYLRTRAAPRGYVQVDWDIYRQGLLPPGAERDHYEVKIVAGTTLAGIKKVLWASDDPRDLRLEISSQAESPFHWFEAQWKVFHRESRQRNVIDKVLLPLASPAGHKGK